jgi:hypothetical protein
MLFFLAGGLFLPPPLLAQDVIDVQRDQDKTVYTIGPDNRTEQEDQEDKAWEMLKNMGIVVDQRKGRRIPNPPAQPVPGQ